MTAYWYKEILRTCKEAKVHRHQFNKSRPKDEVKVETQVSTQIVLVGLKQDLAEDANEVKSNPTIQI